MCIKNKMAKTPVCVSKIRMVKNSLGVSNKRMLKNPVCASKISMVKKHLCVSDIRIVKNPVCVSKVRMVKNPNSFLISLCYNFAPFVCLKLLAVCD